MRINNIRAPHLGQDGQAMTWGENPISAYRCTENLLAGEPYPYTYISMVTTE
jgi:hypothetical protein